MSTVSAPFGLRPVYSPSGVVRPSVSTILSGYASNIYQNQPVLVASSGGGDGTIQTMAALTDRIVGTFQGVEWTDTDGRRRVSNKWTGGTTGTDIVAYYTYDPQLIYEIQANGPIAQADLGKQFKFTAIGTGSSVVGISQMMLDTATSTANASIQLLGITPGSDNAYGDNFTIAQVRISQHQYAADIAAF